MDVDMVDAHLWSIGIGSDARKLRIIVWDEYGGDGEFGQRLRTFGAEVVSMSHFQEAYFDGDADYAVVVGSTPDVDALADIERALRPDGRYLVVIEPLALGDSLVMTSVEQIGGECVRVTGYRPRREGE